MFEYRLEGETNNSKVLHFIYSDSEADQQVLNKTNEQPFEWARELDEELTKLRMEVVSLRFERDKAVLERKKDVQEQRDNVGILTLEQKIAFDSCMKQVEDMRKELQDAESRAVVAEAKCSDLEARLKSKMEEISSLRQDITTSLLQQIAMLHQTA